MELVASPPSAGGIRSGRGSAGLAGGGTSMVVASSPVLVVVAPPGPVVAFPAMVASPCLVTSSLGLAVTSLGLPVGSAGLEASLHAGGGLCRAAGDISSGGGVSVPRWWRLCALGGDISRAGSGITRAGSGVSRAGWERYLRWRWHLPTPVVTSPVVVASPRLDGGVSVPLVVASPELVASPHAGGGITRVGSDISGGGGISPPQW